MKQISIAILLSSLLLISCSNRGIESPLQSETLTSMKNSKIAETNIINQTESQVLSLAQQANSINLNDNKSSAISILNKDIILQDIPQLDENITYTISTRYISSSTSPIETPHYLPAVIDGVTNPAITHIFGPHSYEVVEGVENPTDYYLAPCDNHGTHGGSPTLRFHFDGDKFEFIFHSYTRFKMLVDEGDGFKYANGTDYIQKGKYERVAQCSVLADFGSAKPRDIIIQLNPGDRVGGFIYNEGYTITPMEDNRDLAVFIGSSLTDCSTYGGRYNSWNYLLTQRLGMDWLNLGQGGTGFCNNSSNYKGKDKVRGRMELDVYPKNPQLLMLEGSYNDMGGGISVEKFGTECDTLFSEVKNRLPNCLSIVVGTFATCRDLKPEGFWDEKNDMLRKMALKNGLPFIDSLNGNIYDSKGNIIASGDSWLTGSGYDGNPKGDGNSDFYIGDDHTHFNEAGNKYISEKMIEAVTSIINAEKKNRF